ATATPGLHRAGSVTFGGVTIDATLALHGDAELFADQNGRWRRVTARPADRIALIVAGPPGARVVAQLRPTAAPLLADDTDRGHRASAYGAALPELGWVTPYEVDRSLGLDGWIHAAIHKPGAQTCGPPIARPCAPSPLDGVLECKVALQPELAETLA